MQNNQNNQIKPHVFESDKEFLRNLMNNFGSLLVYVFYSKDNQQSVQFLNNFNNSINIFGSYHDVKYFTVQAKTCPQTLNKFNVQVTPTVIFTQTYKTILKKYQKPTQVGSIFDDLSIQLQKYREQQQKDRQVWIPKIDSIITSCPIIIFIKGTVQNPKCGFTTQMINVLKEQSLEFTYYDIVEDAYMRSWLRQYKGWPTFPQLFINGKLIGGLDKTRQIIQQGKFAQLIPESSKIQDADKKYQQLVKQHKNIAFTSGFSFQNKETEKFLNQSSKKYEDLYVINVDIDAKLKTHVLDKVQAKLPFIVVQGAIVNN